MPIIEEVDDDAIDQQHFSIDDFDQHTPFSKDTPIDPDAPVQLVPTAAAKKAASQSAKAPSPQPSSSRVPPPPIGTNQQLPTRRLNPNAQIPEHMKKWAEIYPIYLDKKRSIKDGRRVPKSMAVENPLAVIILDACRSLGYDVAFEITKMHPNDWSNPGRVRVNLPEGKPKASLYSDICMYLKLHPVSSETAREMMYREVAEFDSLEPLAVPYNMKFNKTLPGISPALSWDKAINKMMQEENLGKMMGF